MAPNSSAETILSKRRLSESDPQVKEVLYDGYFYDVTTFARKHPGGSIIEYYTKHGEDATLSIQQFHHRSTKKVSAIMNSFKRRKAEGHECEYNNLLLYSTYLSFQGRKNDSLTLYTQYNWTGKI